MQSRSLSLLLCGLLLLPLPAAAQSQPDAAPTPPVHLLIVGGREGEASAAQPGSSPIPHWVVLGAPHAEAKTALESPSADQCGAAAVTYSRQTPTAVKDLPETTVRGAVVTETQLEAWGASTALLRRLRDTDVSLEVDREAPSQPTRYCVAAAVLPLASTDAEQRAVARVHRDTTAGLTARSLAVVEAGTYSGGGTYFFEATRPRMVIVDRSTATSFGYAGTQARGQYTVILGRWDAAADTVVPPSLPECASTEVTFRLLAPTEAGPAVPKAPVRAFVADSSFASRLFPKSYANPEHSSPEHPSRKAGIRKNGDLHFCVAQSPIRLAGTVGYQRVVAQVKRDSWASPDFALEEARQVTRANSAAAESYFDRIRVHAKPRPFVGGLYVVGGFDQQSTDSTGTVQTKEVHIMPIAGLDIPLEPYFKFGYATRLILATELSGDFGEQIYVGVSLQSVVMGTPPLSGTQGTASTVDFAVGVSLRTKESFRVFGPSISILLDVRSSLKALGGVFGLS